VPIYAQIELEIIVIQYSLICENNHKFEAWFRNSQAYAQQSEMGIVSCPLCSSGDVKKALMAPAISHVSKQDNEENFAEPVKPIARKNNKIALAAGHPQQDELRAAIKNLRDVVTKEADYVGENFALEARKIHEQQIEPRKIYGEATKEEISSLVEDGIDFLPLPTLPEEHN